MKSFDIIPSMTREEIIVAMMPFSKQLKNWIGQHTEIQEALKVIYPSRFIALRAISITFSPLIPNDEVIGIYAYDYLSKTPKFKQDFIVNKNSTGTEYILYTRLPSRKYSKYVRDINEFFSAYSKNQYYIDSHHVKYSDIPDKIKPRALQVIELANRCKRTHR